MNWQFPEPLNGVSVTIESDGIWLRNLSDLKARQANNRLGRLLPSLLPQLLELGLAEQTEDSLRISHQNFARLEDEGIDAFDNVAEWSLTNLPRELQPLLARHHDCVAALEAPAALPAASGSLDATGLAAWQGGGSGVGRLHSSF